MRQVPPLKAVLAFDAAARHSSVTDAAEELHVSPSAVSHQIRLLEDYFGVALFRRVHRRLDLTDAGRGYLQFVETAFDRLEAGTRRVVDQGFSDVLTVHCAPSFAPSWLMPRLPDFLQRHPEIDVRLHATPDEADFQRTNVDVEIRHGNGNWPGMLVVPVLSEEVVPLASPKLCDRLPPDPSPNDIARLPLIHSERSPVKWPMWLEANGITGVDLTSGLRFDRGYLSIQAAVSGLGVALESAIFASREIASGELMRLCDGRSVCPDAQAHYLICPRAHAAARKVQVFVDWIGETARAYSMVARHVSS